jgi:hypothetical protein
VGNTSTDSAKFGEYNGLNKSGANAIVNFNLRGGDAYNGGNGRLGWERSGSVRLNSFSLKISGAMAGQKRTGMRLNRSRFWLSRKFLNQEGGTGAAQS